MAKELKLCIELVPKTCWYNNMRHVYSKEAWDRIRKKAYADAKHLCQVCGVNSRLNCHEIWGYDDERNVQYLKGFQALCDDCHDVKHYGFAEVMVHKGKWPKSRLEELVAHFNKVNGISEAKGVSRANGVSEANGVSGYTFRNHLKNSAELWEQRSGKQWKTVLHGDYEKHMGIVK